MYKTISFHYNASFYIVNLYVDTIYKLNQDKLLRCLQRKFGYIIAGIYLLYYYIIKIGLLNKARKLEQENTGYNVF